MAVFTQGELIEKQGIYGVYYEMKFRLFDGRTIPVFYHHPGTEEEDDPISELLEPETSLGAVYEFLIIVQVLRNITFASIIPPHTSFDLIEKDLKMKNGNIVKRNDLLRGRVVDPSWDAASFSYQAVATHRIYEQSYVLLETGIGNVVVGYHALQDELDGPIEQITTGGYLEWKQGRMDLLAIIAKRESEPREER